MLEKLVRLCDERYQNNKCDGCLYGDNCPHDCGKCLEYVHFPNRAPIQRHYDCIKMMDYYVCKYAFKYTSELVYAFARLIEAKGKAAMLGYLNAPSPFTEDGWFMTGDEVLVDGEYMKILGRKSELINVGGLKVFPAEVESVLLTMDGVEDVAVNGEKSELTGNIVKVRVKLNTGESVAEFRKRMRTFCKGKLESFKIPQKVVLVEEMLTGARFKKMRKE